MKRSFNTFGMIVPKQVRKPCLLCIHKKTYDGRKSIQDNLLLLLKFAKRELILVTLHLIYSKHANQKSGTLTMVYTAQELHML